MHERPLRARLLSIWLVGMLIVSALPIVLPTAAAGHSVSSEFATLKINGTASTSASVVLARIGSTFTFDIRVKVSTQTGTSASTCTGANPPNVTMDADLTAIGLRSNEGLTVNREGSGSGPDYLFRTDATQGWVVKEGDHNGDVDRSITVTVNASCTTDIPPVQSIILNVGTFRVDNKLPSATAVVDATTSATGIGAPFEVRIANRVDVAEIYYDFSHLNSTDPALTSNGAFVPAASVPTTILSTVADTGVATPLLVVHLKDSRGQTKTVAVADPDGVDAKRPDAIALNTYQLRAGTGASRLEVQFTKPADSDIQDYRFTVTDTDAGTSATLDKPVATPESFFGLAQAGWFTLETNTNYTVAIAPIDRDRNVGNAVTKSVRTLTAPAGKVVATPDGSGVRGIGSTYTLSLADLVDVHRVVADVSQIAGPGATVVWANGTLGQTRTVTVVETGTEAPTATATLHPWADGSATVTLVRPDGSALNADAKAPGAPGSLAVKPRPNGIVHVDVAAPADTDVQSYQVRFRKDGESTFSAPQTIAKSGNTQTLSLTFTGAALGARHYFQVRTVDDAGNPSAWTPADETTLSTVPATNPLFVDTVGEPEAVRDFTSLVGTWTAPAGLTPATDRMNLSVRKEGTNQYWDASAGAFMTKTSGNEIPAYRPVMLADGTWSIDLACATAGCPNLNHANMLDGRYVLNVTLNDNAGNTNSSLMTMSRDRTAPAFTGGSTKNELEEDIVALVARDALLRVRLNVSDATSGIGWYNFTVTDKTTDRFPAKLAGQTVSVACETIPSGACTIGPSPTGTGTLVTFPVPRIAPGDYHVNVTVADKAGNAVALPLTLGDTGAFDTLRVLPRLAIDTVAAPSLGPNGIDLVVRGAWDNETAFDSNLRAIDCGTDSGVTPAVDHLCRFSEVRFIGRNASATAVEVDLGARTLPRAVPEAFGTSGAYAWNYSPSTLPLNGLDANGPIEVKAVARWRPKAEAAQSVAETGWVRVRAPTAPGGFTVLAPAQWAMNSSTTVDFNATFLVSLPAEAPPYLEWNVTRLDVEPPAVTTFSARWPLSADIPIPGPLYFYNWSYTAPASGEYLMQAVLRSNHTGAQVLGSGSRYFSVETQAPQVFIANVTPQPSIVDRSGKWVERQLFLETYIAHGFANVTFDDLNFTLLQGSPRAPNAPPLLNESQGGFEVALVGSTGFDPTKDAVRANLSVTLPPTAQLNDTFELTIEAKADNGRTHAAAITFSLDTAPPAAGVLLQETRDTGASPTSELLLKGFATETGAGVTRVEVRIVNVTGGSTFNWNLTDGGSFETGEHAYWGSSDLLRLANGQFFRPVWVQSRTTSANGEERLVWIVNSTTRPRLLETGGEIPGATLPAIPLDRASTYRIEVRARDALGHLSVPSVTTLRFDGTPPVIDEPSGVPAGIRGPAAVDWHGSAILTANVTDNYCVKRVSLVGLDPQGRPIGPADFRRAGGNPGCPEAGSFADRSKTNWTLDLATAPHMTNVIGVSTYWLQVEDLAGHVVNTTAGRRNFQLEVRDVTPPRITSQGFTPPIAAAATSAQLSVGIEENQGIQRIDVLLFRNVGDASILIKEGRLRPATGALAPAANGTGTWLVDTGASPNGTQEDGYLNVTLDVGNYTFLVRPRDVRGAQGEQQPFLLRVVNEAAPAISLDTPATDGGWISGAPTLRWRVVDARLTPAGISLVALNESGAPTTLNFTTQPITAAGNVTGYFVTATPTGLADGKNVTFRLTANSQSGRSTTNETRFRVDATPPTATHEVLGARTVGNTTWAVDTTRVRVDRNDTGSGIASTTYGIGAPGNLPYTGPVPVGDVRGAWRLFYTVRDQAGNTATGNVSLQVDVVGPTVVVARESDAMLLIVDDVGAGVDADNVTVHYAYGTEVAFRTIRAVREAGNSFAVDLPGNASESGLRYYIVAQDVLGNRGGTDCDETFPCVVEPKQDGEDPGEQPPPPPPNRPPTVTITAPTAGQEVRGAVTLRWVAEDPDGDAVNVTIALQEPAGPGSTLRTNAPATGSLPVVLDGKPAGPYTFVVLATDDERETARAQVTFTVLAGRTVETLQTLPPSAAPGEEVSVGVTISPAGKTVKAASYVLKRDGVEVASGPLARGASGAYTGVVTPSGPGEYEVLVVVAYEESPPDAPVSLGTFSVAGSGEADKGWPMSLLTLVVLGVLVIALAAGGAFARWKK